jgi:uncharacterized protein involved in outer membrane biogenesis
MHSALATSRASTKPRFTRRRVFLLLIPPALLLLYVLFGFFAVPWIVRHPVMARVTERLNGRADVGRVTFNPFTLEMHLDNMRVVDAAARPVAGFEHAYVNLQVSSLWHHEWVFGEIVVSRPFGKVDIDRAGVFNLRKLLKPQPKEEQLGDPPALAIDRLVVDRATFDYTDLSRAEPLYRRADSISFTLDHFKTRPENQNPYTFTATTAGGERIALEGAFYLDPLTADGRLTIEQIDVPTYFPLYSQLANCRVAGGKLTVKLSYRFAPTHSPKALSLAIESMELSDLILRPRNEAEPFFNLKRVALTDIDADVVNRSLRVKKVSITGGRLTALRTAGGRLTLVDWLTPPAPAAGEPATHAAETAPRLLPKPTPLEAALVGVLKDAHRPWTVKIESVELADHQLVLEDKASVKSVTFNLTQAAFTAGPISSQDDYTVPMKFSAHIGEKASVAIEGRIEPLAPRVDLRVSLTDLDLTPLDAYWTTYVAAKLPSGRVSLNGRLTGDRDSAGKLSGHFVGQTTLHDVELINPGEDEPLASVDEMTATGLDAEATQVGTDLTYRIGIQKLELQKPAVRVILTREPIAAGTQADQPKTRLKTNLDKVMSEPLPLPRGVQIDHVTIKDGLATLDDRTQLDALKVVIHSIDIDGRGLANNPDARLEFEIKGRGAGGSLLRIEGSMLSVQPTLDTTFAVTMNDLPLLEFDTYCRRYLGYAIASGKLNFIAKYTIKDHRLVGDNKAHFDRLYLGERYKSPDAVDLPIKLAIGLLRDRKDQIHLDVPLRGDLNAPMFSLSAIIGQAIGTTLERIAASPFDMLAALLEARDIDLSRIRFNPGTANPAEGEAAKLDLLVKALEERPGLVLGVRGTTDPAADTMALRRMHLKELIRQEMKNADGAQPGTPATSASLSEVDYHVAVARLFLSVGKDKGASGGEKSRHDEHDLFRSIFGQKKEGLDQPAPAAETVPPANFKTMEAAVLETISLQKTELADLARQRVEAVRKVLRNRLDPARLVDDKPEEDAKPAASVVFELR